MSCNDRNERNIRRRSCCDDGRDAREGLRDIRVGIKKCQEATREICCNNIHRSKRLLEESICCVEQGLERLLAVVDETEITCGCGGRRALEQGVCCLNEGLEDLKRAQEELKRCNMNYACQCCREGMRKLERGLRCCCQAINRMF